MANWQIDYEIGLVVRGRRVMMAALHWKPVISALSQVSVLGPWIFDVHIKLDGNV